MTTETELRFRSRIDAWLVAVILSVLLSGPILVIVIVRATRWDTLLLIVMGTTLLPALLAFLMFMSTVYIVTDTTLVVRCGPMRWRIPLDNVTAIIPTRTIESSPALSLDRLEVQCNGRRAVVISPRDKQGFISAVEQRTREGQSASGKRQMGMANGNRQTGVGK